MASIIYGHDGMLTYMGTCIQCHSTVTLERVPVTEYATWRKGAPVEWAFSTLTADEREFLIAGVCGPCFDSSHSEE